MALVNPLKLTAGKKTEIAVTDVINNVGPRYQNLTYSSGVPTVVEFHSATPFATANRVARNDLTYTGDLLTSEALKVYDTDGTTVLKTYTWTHTYSGVDLQSSALVIT
jgi:hypothetical protein